MSESSPRAFISYSWSSPDHEAWVLRFAEELRSQSVDVILDKWDLREGHDANAFMEQMVTREDIKKVIMVCDKKYAAKSDSREGGAGTEAQIISAGLYTKTSQDKFVAVVRERDINGHAYLPTFYKGRIYIDLVDEARYGDEFDRLLRWIYDKPLYLKPDLGKAPAFLSSSETVRLATAVPLRRAVDAIKAGRDQSEAVAEEYLETVIAELKKFRLENAGGDFDDLVVSSIENFLPYRNELIEFFITVAAYRPTDGMASVIHRFFERLIIFHYPEMNKPHTNWSFDNYKFISNELFLYFVAAMISKERFDFAAQVVHTDFYVASSMTRSNHPMKSYTDFNVHIPSLEAYNKKKGLRKISIQAHILEERSKGVGIEFRHLMAADFVLYLAGEQRHLRWYPFTLVYAAYHSVSFEIFARAASLSYFDKIKRLLSSHDVNEFKNIIVGIEQNQERIPRFDYNRISPSELVYLDRLGSRN